MRSTNLLLLLLLLLLTFYVCRRINLILAHVVSALLRLLYGTHFLQTFVHVHFMALLPVS